MTFSFRVNLLLIGAISLLGSFQKISANPSGHEVIVGEAYIEIQDRHVQIRAGDKAIINWENFSIGKDEVVRFIQPSSKSCVLNRVKGQEISHLQGSLLSNGSVYLINPNGVVIGKDAFIDTGAFLASSLDALNEDFLNNTELIFKSDSNASIINLGKITASNGDVVLIGYHIENRGNIEAKQGQALLASGKEIILRPLSHDKLTISASFEAQGASIINSGHIEALIADIESGGNLYSTAIKQEGSIHASSIHKEGGKVRLVAKNSKIEISGKINANAQDKGGKIQILGQTIKLASSSTLDASGIEGGGTILIGGDYKGENPEIHNAQKVFVEKGSVSRADALREGDGGKIVFWSEEYTEFSGSASTKGGAISGDGGLIEVSSGQNVFYDGNVDRGAPNGKSGLFLLDPKNITIATGGAAPPNGQTFNSNIGSSVTIAPSSIVTALETGAVVLQANTDITVTDGFDASGVSGNFPFTMQAGRSIAIDDSITLKGGVDFSCAINDSGAQVGDRTAGNASFSLASGKSINMGGAFNLQIGNFGAPTPNTSTVTIDGNISNTGGAINFASSSFNGSTSTFTVNGTLSSANMEFATASGVTSNFTFNGAVTATALVNLTTLTSSTASYSFTNTVSAATLTLAPGSSSTTTYSFSDLVSVSSTINIDATGVNNFNVPFNGGLNYTAAGLTATGAYQGTITLGSTSTLLTLTSLNTATIELAGDLTLTAGAGTPLPKVTVTANSSITTTNNGSVGFTNTVDGPFGLTVDVSGGTGNIQTNGIIGGTTPLGYLKLFSATDIQLGNSITTAGDDGSGVAIHFNSQLYLGNNVTITSTGGSVDIAAVDNAAATPYGLNIEASGFGVVLNGAIGSVNGGLASLEVSGSSIILQHSTVQTQQDGSVVYVSSGNVNLFDNITTGNDTSGGQINITGNLVISGVITLNTLGSSSGGGDVGINGAILGTTNNSDTLIIQVSDSNIITFGGSIGTGVLSLSALNINQAAFIVFAGDVFTTVLNIPLSSAIYLNGDTTFTIGGDVTFGNTIDNFDTTPRAFGVNVLGYTATFSAALGGDVTNGGLASVTVSAAILVQSSTVTTQNGAVSYTCSSYALINADITTSGTTSGGAIVINGTTMLNQPLTFNTAGTSSGGGDISFNGSLDSETVDSASLTLDAGSAIISLGSVGSISRIYSFFITNAGSIVFAGDVNVDTLTLSASPVMLNADVVFNLVSNDTIFGSSIDNFDTTPRALTLNTHPWNITIAGAVGADPTNGGLASLTANSASFISQSSINAGYINITASGVELGGEVTTSGANSGNALNITGNCALSADINIIASGGNIVFNNFIDNFDTTPRTLTISAPGHDVDFKQNVGGGGNGGLAGLVVTDAGNISQENIVLTVGGPVSYTATTSINLLNNITTSDATSGGSITMNGPLVISGSITFTSAGTVSGGGNISFQSIAGTINVGDNLFLDAGSSGGSINFQGNIGANGLRLDLFNIVSASDVVFASDVFVNSISLAAGVPVHLNGPTLIDVTTGGAGFDADVNNFDTTAQSLTINAPLQPVFFTGAVGNDPTNGALFSLVITDTNIATFSSTVDAGYLNVTSSDSIILSNTITASSSDSGAGIVFNGLVGLDDDIVIISSGGSIAFGGVIDNIPTPRNLTVVAPSQTVNFNGAIGSFSDGIGSLTVTSASSIIQTSSIRTQTDGVTTTGNVSFTATNIEVLGDITTSGTNTGGAISFNGSLQVSGALTFTSAGTISGGGNISFGNLTVANNDVDTLTLEAGGGSISFQGILGQSSAILHTLTVSSAISVEFTGDVYVDSMTLPAVPVLIDGDLTFNIITGGLSLGSTLDNANPTPQNITILATGQTVSLAGVIGGDVTTGPLGSLTITADDITFGSTVDVGYLSTTGITQFTGNVTTDGNNAGVAISISGQGLMNGDILFTATAGSILFNSVLDNASATARALTVAATGQTVTFTGAVGGSPTNGALSSLTVTADSIIQSSTLNTVGNVSYTGNATLNDAITTSGGSVIIDGVATLGAAVTVDTTNAGGASSGDNISFTGAISGTSFNLTLISGTTGAITLGTSALNSITLNTLILTNAASVTINGALNIGALNTASNNSYSLSISNGGTITTLLGASNDATFSNTGAVTIGSSASSTLTITNGVNTAVNNKALTLLGSLVTTGSSTLNLAAITLNANSTLTTAGGDITLAGTVSGGANNFTADSDTGITHVNAAVSTTSGTITFSGPVETAGVTIGSSSGAIIFASTLDAVVSNTGTITVNAGTGVVTFTGAVGSLKAAAALVITGSEINQTLTAIAGDISYNADVVTSGTITATTGNVNITGTASLADSVFSTQGTITIIGDTLITADITLSAGSSVGAVISIASITDDTSPFNLLGYETQTLTIDTIGDVLIDGDVNVHTFVITQSGGVDVSGTTLCAVLTITDTNGTVNFEGAVTIDSALNTAAQNYSITFGGGGTVTPATTFANTGNLTFGNDSTVVTTTFTGGVDTTSATTILKGNLSTTNSNMVLGVTTLSRNSTLASSNGNINLNGLLNAASSGIQTLTVNAGSGIFTNNSVIGGATPLGTLSITAATINIYANISTNNANMSFTGATVAKTVTIASAGGNISFSSTLDGFNTTPVITITAGAGTVTFTGSIGSITPNALSVTAANIIQSSSAQVGIGGLTYNGNATLNGNITSAAGNISIANTTNTVTLLSSLTIASNGGTILLGNVGGAFTLTLNGTSTGAITINSLSSSPALVELTITHSSSTTITTTATVGTVTITNTAGEVTFTGALTLTTAFNTASQGYSVVFSGGGTITPGVTFLNTGGVTFGSTGSETTTFSGAVDTTNGTTILKGVLVTVANGGFTNSITAAGVTLSSNSSINSNGNAITLGAVSDGVSAFALTINAKDSGSSARGSVSIVSINIDSFNLTDSSTTSISGTTNATTVVITTSSTSVTFNGSVAITSLSLGSGNYSVVFNTGGTISYGATSNTAVVFNNTAGVTFGNSSSFALTITEGVDTTAGTTTIIGALSTTNADIDMAALTLSGNASLTSGTANISLGDVTDGSSSFTLAVNAGTAGNITITSLNVATFNVVNSSSTTVGNSSSNSTIGIADLDATTNAITFNGTVAITTLTTAAQPYTVVLNNTANIENTVTFLNTGGVTLGSANTSSITFTGGANTSASNTILWGTITTPSQVFTTSGLALNGNSAIQTIGGSTSGANITLGAVTDNATSLLTINAGSLGDVTITSLNINAFTLANSQLLMVSGTTTATAAVTLTDTQDSITFTGNLTCATLSIPSTPPSYNLILEAGGAITNAVNFRNTGGVTLGTGSSSSITFTGGVTSTASLTTVYGSITANGTGINFGAVDLSGSTTLVANNLDITLGAVTGSGVLGINAGSGGDISIGAIILSGTGEGITITNSSSTIFSDDITVNVLNIINTSTDVTFNGVLTVGATFTLAAQPYNIILNEGGSIANTVTFANTGTLSLKSGNSANLTFVNGCIVSGSSGPSGVDMDGVFVATNANATINIGADLTISGASSITTNNGNITLGVLTLVEDLSVNSGSGIGNLTFNGTIDGAFDLTLTAGTGTITFNSAIGGITPLETFIIDSSANISAQNVTINNYVQNGGNWSQITNPLPTFSVNPGINQPGFQINDGTFLRFLGGDGTPSSPYQVYDIFGLQGAATSVNSSYSLTGSSVSGGGVGIDGTGTAAWNSGAGFMPIGNDITPFAGTFNGNKKILQNITINNAAGDNLAIFGVISSAATIESMRLKNIDVTGHDNVGTLVGKNSGTISEVLSVTGTVIGNDNVGGLIGQNVAGATLEISSSQSSASGESYVGGLVGYNLGNILNCYAQSNATAATNYAGGLIGYNNASVEDCYSTGVASATDAGGFIGLNDTLGTATDSFFDEQTSGTALAFGLNNAGAQTVSGENTSTMKAESTYTSAGWDFTDIWDIQPSSYPNFQWTSTGPILTLTGIVTNSGSPYAGATIQLIIDDASTPSYSATTDGSGVYVFDLPTLDVIDESTLLLYIDDPTNKANTLVQSGGSSMFGINLEVGSVILRNDSTSSLTNTVVGTAASGSAERLYAFNSGTNALDVNSGYELLVQTGTVMTVNGNITTINQPITFNSNISLAANATINAGSAAISMQGISGSSYSLTIGATSPTTGNLSLAGSANLSSITLAGVGVATFGSTLICPSVTISNSTGAITFEDDVTITTLSVASSVGDIHFETGGSISNAPTFSNTSSILYLGNSPSATITFSAGISFSGDSIVQGSITAIAGAINLAAVEMAADSSFTTQAGNDIILGDVIGNYTLAIDSNATGDTTIASLNATGFTVTAGRNIEISGASDLDHISFISSSGGITFNGALALSDPTDSFMMIAGGSYDVIFNAGGNIYPAVTFNNTGDVVLGNSGSSSLNFTNGFSSASATTHTFGAITSASGSITMGAFVLDGNTALTTTNQTITCGAVSGSYTLALDSGSGAISLSSLSITTLTLIDCSNINITGTTAANTVTLTSSSGTVTFGGNVSITTLNPTSGINNVVFNSGGTVTNAVVFANTGSLTLGNNTISSITFVGGIDTDTNNVPVNVIGTVATTNTDMEFQNVVLVGVTTLNTGNGDLHVHGNLSGSFALMINSGISLPSGTITFDGAVGTLASLTAQAQTVVQNSTATTTGHISYTANCTIVGNLTTTTGNITITGTTTIGSADATPLVISTTSGNITLAAVTGSTKILTLNGGTGNISIASLAIATFNLNSSDTTTITGNLSATTLNLNDTSSLIAFQGNSTIGTVNTVSAKTYAVAIAGGSVANAASFANSGGVIFGTSSTSTLTFGNTLTVSNATTLNGDIAALSMTLSTLTLASNSSLTTSNSTLTISGTINGDYNLELDAGSGVITLQGAVGSTTPIRSFTLTAANVVLQNNITTANSDVTFNATVSMQGYTINTGSGIGNIVFNSTLEASGTVALTFIAGTGSVTFFDTVGAASTISALSVTATVTHMHEDITTNGEMSFNSDLAIDDDMTLDSNNSNIFAFDVTGAHTLTINAGSAGNIEFTAHNTTGLVITNCNNFRIEGTTIIGTLVITACSDTIEFDGAVTLNTAFTIAAEPFDIDFKGNCNITPDTTFENTGLVTLGPNASIINTFSSGFERIVGTTHLGGSLLTTADPSRLGGIVTLVANAAISTNGGVIILDGTINGNYSLFVDGGTASVTVNSAIGSTTRVSSFTASGSAIYLGGSISAQGGTITLNDPVILTANVILDDSGSTGIRILEGVSGAYDLTLITSNSAATIVVTGDVNLRASSSDGGSLEASSLNNISFNSSINTSGGASLSHGFDAGSVTINSSLGSITVGSITASGSNGASGFNGGDAADIMIQPCSNYTSGSYGAGTYSPDGTLQINGNIEALGGSGIISGMDADISLSATGRAIPMSLATIFSSTSGNNISLSGANITLGTNEAITIFGTFTIDASSSTTLTDVVATDDISISAPIINLNLYESAIFVSNLGATYTSEGAHILTPGTLNVTGTKVYSGTGADTVISQITAYSKGEFGNILTYGGEALNYYIHIPSPPPTPSPSPAPTSSITSLDKTTSAIMNSSLFYLFDDIDYLQKDQKELLIEGTFQPLFKKAEGF